MPVLLGSLLSRVYRYSSNPTFTINLLCGFFGIDYYDILEGLSNGLELLHFIALEQKYPNGNPILSAIAGFITPAKWSQFCVKCFYTSWDNLDIPAAILS